MKSILSIVISVFLCQSTNAQQLTELIRKNIYNDYKGMFRPADGKLLKLNPIDKNNRILYMNYMNKDLTDKGVIIFNDLIHKWLSYTDRTNKIDNLKMLEKYYITILQEKELTE